MKDLRIIAVVVTYNRRALLQQCIQALRQNYPAQIIVVDNGATDGTHEWLDTQSDLHVIHQENVGGSGGFYTGIQAAMDAGADWIWCMDDDVRPHPDCLEHLLPHCAPEVGILAPRRLMEGQVFTNDFCRYNLTNPFSSMYQDRLRKRAVTDVTPIVGTAFEGLFVSRLAVQQIGLPNRDLFIFCDDTDYCLRAHLAGFQILYVPQALMDKEHFFNNDSWTVRQQKKKWKRFYQIRNAAYLNHHYGQNIFVRYFRSLNALLGDIAIVLLTAPFTKAYKLSDARRMIQSYRDGIHERLGRY